MNKIRLAVYLDAGHGLNTPGNRSPILQPDLRVGRDRNYMPEWEFNHKVVNCIRNYFMESVIPTDNVVLEVVHCSPGNTDDPLNHRVSIANNHRKNFAPEYSVFVSIHANAFDGEWKYDDNSGTGTETFYHPNSEDGAILANYIQHFTSANHPLRNRGIKQQGFYVLNRTTMPAVLFEGGFMDHLYDIQFLLDPEYHQYCGKQISHAIMKYFGYKLQSKILFVEKSKQIEKEQDNGRVQDELRDIIERLQRLAYSIGE